VGATRKFTAVGRDSGGNLVAITPVWSVAAGGGTVDGSGVFTAGPVAGTFSNTVRATNGSVSGSATVIVTVAASPTPPGPTPPGPTPPDSTPTSPGPTPPGPTPTPPAPVATIVVTPNPDTLAVNTAQQFTAVGRDAGGTIVAITPVWSVVAGGGGISGSGLFTAGLVAGTFPNTVRATSGSVIGSATVVVTATVLPPTPALVNLGAAATHGILAGSTITCVALGTVNADASVWPGSAITGFPPCVVTGARHAADAYAQTAQGSLTVAYNQLAALPCGVTITTNLGGQTLAPGVYCSTSSVGLTGEMFFDALGDSNATLVVVSESTLTTASARVTLLNGAQARNIYWLVKSSATVGLGSQMKGNIIAFTSITMNDNSTLLGRALARNGAVTLGSNDTITLP
jgi:hypothetical protein